MSDRSSTGRLLSLLIMAASAPIVSQLPAADERRPDIVVFLSDDHGQLDSTPYGATDVRTPNLARLAQAGMVFTHAFAASPACAPSRAAMLTGLMPARNGAEANHTFKRDDVASLPDVLRWLGYQTAAFGKVAHGADVVRHGFDVSDKRHDAAFVETFLQSRDRQQPLCLFVGTHEPHVPWPDLEGYDPATVNLPPTHIDTPVTREQRARYYTDVTKADTQLGEVLDLVRRHLDPARTLVVYSSDHGGQWPFGKWNLYDAGIRVPLIAAWPGVIQPDSRSDAMVQWIDLLPTLIDAAGGDVPAGIDGRSFLPVLRGERDAHRDAIFTTHNNDGRMNIYPIRSVRTAEFKYIQNLHADWAHTTHIDQGGGSGDGWRYFLEWSALAKSDRRAAAVVQRYNQRPSDELYDLRRDPHEQHNLAGDPAHAAVLKQLSDRLADWRQQQGDTGQVTVEPRLLAHPADYRPRDPSTEPPSAKKKKSRNSAARFDPVRRVIEGWTVHVEPALLDGEHAAEGARALTMLANHLQRIQILVSAEPLEKLRRIELWIEHSHPTLKAMQYHPSQDWLESHGHDPRLTRKVHITQARELLSREQMLKHPAVILHELAHGFHDQVLSFDNPEIIAVFDRAKAARVYEEVLLYTGKKVRHYGLSNHKEYFAEGTEAFFYRNDFYPFVRAELHEHDPALHDLLQRIWGEARRE